jgi:hypothetical protein
MVNGVRKDGETKELELSGIFLKIVVITGVTAKKP